MLFLSARNSYTPMIRENDYAHRVYCANGSSATLWVGYASTRKQAVLRRNVTWMGLQRMCSPLKGDYTECEL